MMLSPIALFVTAILAVMASRVGADYERQLQGDEEICFEGFVMDFFCIDRGTLLDNPSVRTLEGPFRHSYHCLVDISRCRNSGFEMLADPEPGSNLYGRALRLDDFGNNAALNLARSLGRRGFCSTCNGQLGQAEEGFRATVRGFLVSDSGVPQLLQTTEVLPSSVGCGNNTFVPLNISTTSGGGGGGLDPVQIHGGLMVVGWGFLLPFGVLSAVFLRHRPDGLWFKIHIFCQVVGYALAVIGIAVAFANFGNVFEDGEGPSFNHASCGVTTMVCGFLQVLAGLLRPHAPHEGEEKKKIRFFWEIGHKGQGYIIIILAYATIYLGADTAGTHRDTFFGAFYATVAFAGVAAIILLVDKFTFVPAEPPQDKKYTKSDKHEGDNTTI